MKKFALAVLLGCLMGKSCLFADLKVHFVGDVSKTTVFNLPSWIEPASIDEAEWVIKVKRQKIIDRSYIPLILGMYAGGALTLAEYIRTDGESDFGIIGPLGGVYGGFVLSSLPIWYGVKYELYIKNLNSGVSKFKRIKTCGPGGLKLGCVNSEYIKMNIIEVGDKDLAIEIAKFFEKHYDDKKFPIITLPLLYNKKENITSVKEIMMNLRVDDDVKLSKVIIYKDGQTQQIYSPSGTSQLSKSPIIPLDLGYNYLKIEAYDWMNKYSAKEVTIFRSKGGGDTLPTPFPPLLTVGMIPVNKTNTLMGGTMGGVTVTIHNIGKGYAYNVKVALSGDVKICNDLGNSKEIEDIPPGDSARVTFRRKLPGDLEHKQIRLKVSVTAENYPAPEEDVLTLTLLPEPENVDIDIPSSDFQREGHALVIGISQYQRAQGPLYALHDAEVFSLYAERVLGIPASNITLLFDEEATWKSIERKVKDIGDHPGWRVIYFAGHGSFDVEDPLSKKAFLAPYDWDPEDASSLLSLDWLLDQVDPSLNDTTLVILDACYTGGEGRSVQVSARPAVLAELPSEYKSIVMASSEGSQISFEFDYTQHGIFTYYFLCGLKGNAADADGWIYLDTLYDYVREQVSAATDDMQIPVIKGSDSEIMIGRIR